MKVKDVETDLKRRGLHVAWYILRYCTKYVAVDALVIRTHSDLSLVAGSTP